MAKKRCTFSEDFKTKVTLAVLKGDKSLAELSSRFVKPENSG